jgi:hypothetical protein
MQYFHRGQRFRQSTGCDRVKDAQDVLRKTLANIEQQDTSTDTIAGLYAAIEHEYATNGRKSLPHLKSLWKNHLAAYFPRSLRRSSLRTRSWNMFVDVVTPAPPTHRSIANSPR